MWKEFSAGRATPGFNFYGNGWDLPVQTYMLAPHEEANCYRSCDIAINCSHFDYSRYSSDRMLRIMGCRALCMTHRFQDIEMDYKDGENVIVWNDFDDLVDKCKYWMKPEQLHQRRKIANAGYELVSKNATWSARAKELLEIVKKYR
jgi:spore maturation protein CgeB